LGPSLKISSLSPELLLGGKLYIELNAELYAELRAKLRVELRAELRAKPRAGVQTCRYAVELGNWVKKIRNENSVD